MTDVNGVRPEPRHHGGEYLAHHHPILGYAHRPGVVKHADIDTDEAKRSTALER